MFVEKKYIHKSASQATFSVLLGSWRAWITPKEGYKTTIKLTMLLGMSYYRVIYQTCSETSNVFFPLKLFEALRRNQRVNPVEKWKDSQDKIQFCVMVSG